MFHGEAILALIPFRETEPFSTQFEMYGMDTKNQMYHSGSFWILFWGFIPVFAVMYLVNRCVLRHIKWRVSRLVGKAIYDSNILRDGYNFYTKMFLETFLDIGLGIIMGIFGIFDGQSGTPS